MKPLFLFAILLQTLTGGAFAAPAIIVERSDTPGFTSLGHEKATLHRIYTDGRVTHLDLNIGKEETLAALSPRITKQLQAVANVAGSDLEYQSGTPCPDAGIVEYKLRRSNGVIQTFNKDDLCRIYSLRFPTGNESELRQLLDSFASLYTGSLAP